jgi:membrane protease YdiL (CAAX protease family)
MFRFQAPNHPVAQFFFVIFLSFTIFFVFLMLSIPVGYLLYGTDALDLSKLNNINAPGILPILEYYQIVQSVGLFVIPPFVIAYFYSSSIKEYLGINQSINVQQLIFAVMIILSVMPLINLLAEYNSQIKFPESLAPLENSFKQSEKDAEEIIMKFLKTSSFSGLMFNMFMVALLPALGEELMFRGVLQKVFTKMTRNIHWGIIISSFLFSAVHFQFYGLFPRWLLGMIFGYMFYWSGSIWAPIIAHFINNAFAVWGYYMLNKGRVSQDTLDTGASTDMLHLTIISTLIFFLACYNFYRYSQRKELESSGFH